MDALKALNEIEKWAMRYFFLNKMFTNVRLNWIRESIFRCLGFKKKEAPAILPLFNVNAHYQYISQ